MYPHPGRPMHPRVVVLALLLLAASSAVPARAAGSYPGATLWGPLGTNVPLEAPIRIQWSLRMDAASVEAAFALTDGDQMTWDATAFDWTHSTAGPWTSEATPRSPLPPDTD